MENDFKFCPDHKCIKDKIDEIRSNKSFWNKIFDSKWFFWVATGIVIVWMSFNVWVTTEIYGQKENTAIEKKVTEVISSDIKEIKQDNKEIKEENKKQDEKIQESQKEILKMLIEIQKQIKK